jgi:succinyl-diaminopimelate desuccinylase
MDVIELTKNLIARPSLTPEDAGCQIFIGEILQALDFKIEHLPFENVSNLYTRRGEHGPLLVFLGHTDVVPTGPEQDWQTPPFTPTIKGDYLYGRGAADMKGSVAAMVLACQEFFAQHTEVKGSVALLLTSDEEGPALHGTQKVLQHLQKRAEQINYCVVGEPSCAKQLGDTIKVGRRGSLSGHLMIHGIQGHIAYPQLAHNPIHHFASALQALCAMQWDQGNRDFQPTSFQISNIHAGTGVNNVIPGTLTLDFNFRFSTASTADELKQKVETLLDQHKLNYTLTWHLGGEAFLTQDGHLRNIAQQAVKEITGVTPEFSTTGGTSDGRFVARYCSEIIEFGPCNASIHKIDESVNTQELIALVKIYTRIMELILL